ncbi:hypothetical protein E8E13_000166 [Curvularia kusanoi]|uniref:ABC transporter n=1 Tax=Curvularia kusanoi TaxID=90978 RepID=A0A9P4W6Y2_CURKU|nr:hypothetical protein E8E13_000166 [Curvularia kusanoi]
MIRGGLISAISAKMMKLDTTNTENGNGYTLISTDVERICQSLRNMHEVWANLIELGIAIYLLARQLSVACIAAVVVVAGCSIGSLALSGRVGESQKVWLEALQDRLSYTSSVLGNIKSLKFVDQGTRTIVELCRLRETELKISLGFRRLLIWIVGLSTTILSPAVTFLVFSIIAMVKNGTTLLANQAFTSLAVLGLLGAPLASMIQSVPSLLAAVACFKRIQAFFSLSEHIDRRDLLPYPAIASEQSLVDLNVDGIELGTIDGLRGPSLHPLIELSAITITGVPGTSLILRNINVTASQSRLLAVTGPVGSGKTTLLKAILGKVLVASGSVATTTQFIAFCAPTTWLQSGSLRQQILFGEPYQAEWYSKVIRACALVQDIANLALGDATEVGNKGDKLSGGQRQRIAIARAVYSKARVMIFDDVLSALDKITADYVFTQVFSSEWLLQKACTTIIMVSQSPLALRNADQIILLDSDGRLTLQGTWEALLGVSSYI